MQHGEQCAMGVVPLPGLTWEDTSLFGLCLFASISLINTLINCLCLFNAYQRHLWEKKTQMCLELLQQSHMTHSPYACRMKGYQHYKCFLDWERPKSMHFFLSDSYIFALEKNELYIPILSLKFSFSLVVSFIEIYPLFLKFLREASNRNLPQVYKAKA